MDRDRPLEPPLHYIGKTKNFMKFKPNFSQLMYPNSFTDFLVLEFEKKWLLLYTLLSQEGITDEVPIYKPDW